MALKDIIDNISLEQLKGIASECSLQELDEAFLETDDVEKNMFLIDKGVDVSQNDDWRYNFFSSMLINQCIVEKNERFFIYNHKSNIDLLGDLFFNLEGNNIMIEKYYRFLENLGVNNYPQELMEELVSDAPLSYICEFFENHDVSTLNLDKLTTFSPKRKSNHFDLHHYYNDLSSAINREGIAVLDIILKQGLKVKKKDYLLLEGALLKEDILAIEKLLSLGVKFAKGNKLTNIMNFLLIQGKHISIEYLLEKQLFDLSKPKLTQGTNIYLYNLIRGERSGWNKMPVKILQLLVKHGLNIQSSSKFLLDSLSNSPYCNKDLIDYLFTININQVGKKFNETSSAGMYIREKINIFQEKQGIESSLMSPEISSKKKHKI